MKLFSTLGLIAACITLSACDDSHYEEDHYSGRNDYPEIYDYEIIDSYGASNLDNRVRNLYVNHAVNHGYFEMLWDVDSFHAFSTGIYVNDENNLANAVELDYNTCYTEGCNKGFAYCYFDSDNRGDYLSCSSSKYENTSYNISDLFRGHPSELYMWLEVCDEVSNLCTSRSQRVTFQ